MIHETPVIEPLRPLALDDLLVRDTDVYMRLDGAGGAYISCQGRGHAFGNATVAWLHAFATPCTVREAISQIGGRLRGRRSLDEALRTLQTLRTAGVIRDPGEVGKSRWPSPASRYDSLLPQRVMLDDPHRKPAFVRALRESVRADDVVLDLGSAAGLLAVVAAQAGARRVFAVEPTAAGHVSVALAEANGVADRVEHIRGWSTQLELDEPATLMVVDLVGNEALDMSILETVRDATDRLLAADARIIPERIVTYAQLVEIPEPVVRAQTIGASHVGRWRERYGVDFSPLQSWAAAEFAGFYERPEVVASWRSASDAVPVYELDLRHAESPGRSEFELQPAAGTSPNGLVLFAKLQLFGDVELSVAPQDGCAESHWYSSAWLRTGEPAAPDAGSWQLVHAYLGDGHSLVESAPTPHEVSHDR